MFLKIVAILVLTILIAFTRYEAYAIPFFVIALGIAFVIESIRVVPQQQAWVVERLGKFHSALEPLNQPGGMSAANLKVAELYIGAFGQLARTNNTLIVPSNVSDVAGLVASAMTVLEGARRGEAARTASAQ